MLKPNWHNFNWIRPRRMTTGVLLVVIASYLSTTVSARYTPNDAFKEKREAFERNLANIADPVKKDKIRKADEMLSEINQTVCFRFQEEVNKLAAIMEEVKERKGIKETRVAYGEVDTPIEQADYWINYGAEAIAYQKIQDYTLQFSTENQIVNSVNYNINSLKSDLGVLKGKILKAKAEVKKAIL